MLGILDSGLGGLSVWKAIKELSPKSGVLYFADSARVPYGNLPKEKIFVFAKECIDHLIYLGATSIGIACHTIATTVGPLLKHSTKVPIFDIATHALPLITPFKRIGIIGTKATINSGFYQRALKEKIASATPCPELVPMIEKGCIDHDIIKNSLIDVDREIETLFLACTHFPLIENALQTFFPETLLFDPAKSFAQALLPLASEAPDEFFTTGDPLQFHQSASIFTGEKKVAFPYLIKSLYSSLIS